MLNENPKEIAGNFTKQASKNTHSVLDTNNRLRKITREELLEEFPYWKSVMTSNWLQRRWQATFIWIWSFFLSPGITYCNISVHNVPLERKKASNQIIVACLVGCHGGDYWRFPIKLPFSWNILTYCCLQPCWLPPWLPSWWVTAKGRFQVLGRSSNYSNI